VGGFVHNVVRVSASSSSRDAVGIREVSERTGLSIDTLRWYERAGLLPDIDRGTDGRRRYSPLAIGFVRLVQVLRRTGMPVAEVRKFVQLGTVGLEHHRSRVALLEEHAAALEERMAQLRADHATVQAEIAHYRDLIARGVDCSAELAEQDVRGDAPAAWRRVSS
jgi:DNA-binding transcriptional MerR regulator